MRLKVSHQQPPKRFIATIIDLETMGMDAKSHEIIEIGMLSFVFTNEEGIIDLHQTYNELNDPGKPIPEEITKITGITKEKEWLNQEVYGRNNAADGLKYHIITAFNRYSLRAEKFSK